jgi:nicotinamidase/pyrazinamidase
MLFNIAKTLFLEIDVQNDFCPAYVSASGEKMPDGTLAVPDAGAVIKPINALAAAVAAAGGRVAATADWHPAGHKSFASAHPGKKPGDTVELAGVTQVLWPDHCVQGSRGAEFHGELDLRPVSLIVRKGFRKELDSYSAFFENDKCSATGLEGAIKQLNVETVIIGGLATDYCVFYSAMDSVRLGFSTLVVTDAVAGVGYPEGSVEKALAEMKAVGIVFTTSEELLKGFD